MKKLLSLIVMGIVAMHAWAAVGDDFNFQNCTYLITKEYVNSAEYGEITCVGLNATGKAAQSLDLTIPRLIARGSNPTRYYRVTKILDGGFYGCDNIVKLTINDKIDILGSRAFASCANLETVKCGAVMIGAQAFMLCEKLNSVNLSEGVTTTIDTQAFQNTAITSFHIPTTVTSIGQRAWMGCKELANIYVPTENPAYDSEGGLLYTKGYKTLIYVPQKCYAPALKFLTFPASTTTIESDAFMDFVNRDTWVVLPYGIKTIKADAFANSEVGRVVIPSTIETIGTGAFRSCKYLNHLFINRKRVLPVTSVLTDAHKPHLYVPYGYEDNYKGYGWENVQDINAYGLQSFDLINRSGIAVTITSTEKFKALDGLNYEGRCMMVKPPLYDENPGAIISLPDSYYYDGKLIALTRIAPRAKSSYSETYGYVAGVNIDSIDSEAFINAKVGIVNLDNVSYIGDHAFDGCTDLTSYTFSPRLRYIGTSAFEDCKLNGNYYPDNSGVKYYMGHVFLPTNLETLGADAFYNTNVQTILIPSTVKNLSPDAFRGMRSVQEIFLNQHPTNWPKFRFTNVPSTCKLYVPVGETQSMRSEIGSAFKANNITSGAFDFAYENSEKVYINKLAEPATIISQTPFTLDGEQYDGKVKYVRCTNTTIPKYTDMWTSKYLNYNKKKYLVTEIGDSCFTDFSYLTSAKLTNITSLERIGYRAFSGTGVTSLTIPESCTKFGTGAFFQATKLKELIILGTKPRTWDGQFWGFNDREFKVYVHNQVLYSNYWTQDYSYWNANDGSIFKDDLHIYVKSDYDNYNLGVCIPLDFATSKVEAYAASGYADEKTFKMIKVDAVRAHSGVILANLTPGEIYKIERSVNAPEIHNYFFTSSLENIDLSSRPGGYYWDCAAKKFSRPSDTSRPFYTGSGRSFLNLGNYAGRELFVDLWPDTPAGKTGDVNGDGKVDVADINILIDIILTLDNASNYAGRADVNGDSKVDVADINTVIDIILAQ